MSEPHGSTGRTGDFWANRPVRPRAGRKIAGVAAGIGERYDVDPVLVRVVLVVLAFYGGSGIALYLLGWLLLPKEGDPGSTSPRPPSTAVLVLVVLLLVPVLLWTVRWPGLFGVALGIGALYLLHRKRGPVVRPHVPPHGGESGGSPGSSSASSSASSADGTPASSTTASASTPTNSAADPPGDPSGSTSTGQYADFSTVDSRSTAVAAEDEPPARRWITLTTLAAAVIAAALATTLGAPVPVAVAVALAVLGAGLVLGSFLHGGRALLLFAVPVGVVALLLGTHAAPGAWIPGMQWDGARSVAAHPTAGRELLPDYRSNSGDVRLDLSDLRATAPARTHVDTNSGQVRVLVPRDADVQARCASGSGDVDCLDDHSSDNDRGGDPGGDHSPNHSRSGDNSEQVTDSGPDGPGGGSIQLDVRSSSGDVEVTRG